MKFTKYLAVMAILATSLLACGKKEVIVEPLSEKNAIITGSIDKSAKQTNYHLTFKRPALSQLFLLTMAEIEGAPTPTGSAWAPKIVFFEIKGNSMFMFESLDGKLSTNSIRTRSLLAEFPIVSQDFDSVTVDFKSGMNLLFYKRSMFSSESGEDEGDRVFKVTNSYIHKVEIRGDYLYINQFVRLDGTPREDGSVPNLSTEIKYTFSTYKKNENFEPTATNGQERVGYFETYPVLTAGSGQSITPIMKFDISKPVVYSITKNIPEDFKQAVIDGVLYWNKVFGKEVLKVNELPENMGVHEPGTNIVQWLEWDTAGFAYANMMADPLTGETLQSHVYMTSVFGLGGYARAKRMFKKYVAEAPPVQEDNALGIRGFKEAHVCQYHNQQSFNKELGQVLSTIDRLDQEHFEKENVSLSDEEKEIIFMRYAQDYVRQVVAHEVGHTLGLRHNFAGSLTTTIDPSIFDTVSKIYFMTGKLLPGMIPTSTVMDYTPSMISSMIGAYIRQGEGALVYDKQAIDFGYSDKEVDPKTFVPFCTDGHKGKGIYHDCKIWDQFANPFDGAVDDLKIMIDSTAYKIATTFDFLKNRQNGEDFTAKINKVKFDPRADAKSLIDESIAPLLQMINNDAQFMAIRNHFGSTLSMFDLEKYNAETLSFKEKSINRLGGLDELLFSTLKLGENTEKSELKIIDQIKAKVALYLTKTIADATESELKALQEKINHYAFFFEREYLVQMSPILAKVNLDISTKTLTNTLLSRVEQLVFAKNASPITNNESGTVFTKTFDYQGEKVDLRSSLISLLTEGNFRKSSPSFQRNLAHARAELLKRHQAEETIVLNGQTANDLNDDLFDWLMIEKKRFAPLK